jgi:predicted dehydrogenase
MKRRDFLRRAAVAGTAAAFPVVLPSTVFGVDAPSGKVTMGFIGVGNQGTGELGGFLGDKRVRVLGVCDPNRGSRGYWGGRVGGRENARNRVNSHYRAKDCGSYEDFRELLARDDIDAVHVATPDHWHALIVIAAARAGKDIYGQKPLAQTIHEGRLMSDAVRRYGRIFQTGSQQRSDWNFRRACELVQNGRIGKLHTVYVTLPSGWCMASGDAKRTKTVPVPDGFNFDLWLGPAPAAPYSPARCHVNWRCMFDYGAGQVTDWGAHHIDCAQWGMGTQYTGPVAVRNATAEYAPHDLYNTPVQFRFEAEYANGVKMVVQSRGGNGVKWVGTDGWVQANRGRHGASSEEIRRSKIGPDEIHLYESKNHFRNFIDCVLSRREPVAPVEVAHRSITVAHLGNIAIRTGCDLKWDPDAEEIIGDAGASRFLRPVYREPWVL